MKKKEGTLKSKKFSIATLVVVIGILALVGCSQQAQSEGDSQGGGLLDSVATVDYT